MKTTLHTFGRRAAASLLALSLTGLLAGSTSAAAASASELLEKGIYSEETKGDIDAAIDVYKQIVAESQSSQALAAQAQYHLGLCLYKKKNYTEASAAFEKLIAEYPSQTEWVTRAREYLASNVSLLPAPWADGEELRLDLKLATGVKLGFTTYTMDSGDLGGQKIWRLGARLFAGPESFSRVEVDADTFKPLHSRWKHSLLGDADTTYATDKAEIKFAGQTEVKTVALEGAVYDNEEVAMGIRRLPLAVGYKNTMRIFTSLGGGNIIPITATVAGIERVEVPAGSFDCFKIELSIVKQTFWYSTNSHRYLVKFAANGVSAELTAVGQRTAGAPVSFQGPGFSLVAPADWIFYQPDDKPSKGAADVIILDPEITAFSQMVGVQPMENLNQDWQKSPRAWAEYLAAKLKNLKVRPTSWQERTLGNGAAVSCIGDYTEGQTDKVIYGICGFVGGKAVNFTLTIAAKDFEDFRSKFDGVVNSYKAN